MKTEIEPAILALAQHIDCSPDDITEESHDHYGLTVYSAEGGEYAVGTDSEADAAWDASMESYLEECIYPELPEMARNYFDDEKWKRDARHDGRGHSLSGYDSNENEEKVGDEWYFIYRIN